MGPLMQLVVNYLGWANSARVLGGMLSVCTIGSLLYRVPSQTGREKEVEKVEEPQQQRPPIFDVTVLKNKAFLVWCISLSAFMMGYFIPFLHLVSQWLLHLSIVHLLLKKLARKYFCKWMEKVVIIVDSYYICVVVNMICVLHLIKHALIFSFRCERTSLFPCSRMTYFLALFPVEGYCSLHKTIFTHSKLKRFATNRRIQPKKRLLTNGQNSIWWQTNDIFSVRPWLNTLTRFGFWLAILTDNKVKDKLVLKRFQIKLALK